MKCCLKNCRNNTKVKKQPGGSSDWVTFHLIPKDQKLRAAWLQALSIPNWMTLNGAAICSDHFKEDDFFLTKQGIRRVKKGVVPFVEGECSIPAPLRACRVCLSIDLKMYQLRDTALAKCYLNIVGIPPKADLRNRLPMGICWECTARLESAASFKAKALFTEALLREHLENNAELNITDIQNYQRDHKNLKPSMAVQEVFKFNSNDFEEHAPNSIKSEAIGIPHNEEIEIEVQNLVTETITIKDESKNVIIEEICPTSDVKTEIDLLPITEINIANNQIDFEELIEKDSCVVKEKVFVNENKVSLDNIVLFKSEAVKGTANLTDEISLDNVDKNISDADDDIASVMDFNDDVVSIGDDDEDEDVKVTNERVKTVKKKKERNKKKEQSVKRKGTKRTYDDVVIWVKGKRPKKPTKTPYVKPCIPIDENIFTVKTLNHEDLRREVLERKEGDQYKLARHKCNVCYKGFPTAEKQARHMVKHSEESGPIKCNICYGRMKRSRDLRAHMKRQHSSEYSCNLCPLVTRCRNVALGHVKYHEGNKYECPQCSVVFEKKTTLLNHLRLKHMSSFVCELCGYTFVSKAGVEVHKRMRHKLFDKNTEFKGQYCEVCDVKFLNDKAYNKHLLLSSKHISEDDPNRISNDPSIKQRRLSCYWQNDRRFTRRPVIHRKDPNSAPAGNKPVTCEQCGGVLESFRAYVAHFRYYHPGLKRTQFGNNIAPYMCEHCGKFFWNTTTLSCHMWVHTGQKRFQCDHCNKSFTMKSNLAGHMRQHDPGVRRTYDCRVCGKQFTFSYNRTRHMFVHTGLRPYKCDACEKTFRTKGELQSHIDYVHLKKPRPKRIRRKTKKCEIPSLEY
ncbi:hypothetical protein PYW08_012266 [Mythimna loreyi]|uniref:Uncharacterized protein n=1 Tax=Mythimna loreyi TaxID=667449 RepID=A0ACC2Q079_9NEOP|nr:hypothetical protein PYW08_012266 [Mythimna loreyi]